MLVDTIRDVTSVLKMKSFVTFLVLAVVFATCSASVTSNSQNALIPAARQQIDLFVNSRKLIEQLAGTLRKAAAEAGDAIITYTKAVQQEAIAVRDKVANDIENLRGRVASAIENVTSRLGDSGLAVRDCVMAHQNDASALLNETMSKTMSCVDTRIAEVSDQIGSLTDMAKGAADFASTALEEMRQCTRNGNGNFLSIGSCLGTVAVQTEMKAVVYGTQNALQIARLNLSIATLPAALEVCAASRIVETGLATARIVMEIGTCSAASVFVAMTGTDSYNNGALTA